MRKIEKGRKVIKIGAVIGILLSLLFGDSQCSSLYVSTDLYGNIYENLLTYNVIETDYPKITDYMDTKEPFTFIKNISSTNENCLIESEKPSLLIAGEGDAVNGVPSSSILTFSYREASEYSPEKKKRHTSRKDTTYQTMKKIVIIPYKEVFSKRQILFIDYLKDLYFKDAKSFDNTAAVVDYAKNIFIHTICKKYIDCMSLSPGLESRIASFTDFLQKNSITKKYLKEIELKDTFVYEIVGRCEAYNLEKDIRKRLDWLFPRVCKKAIEEAFSRNQTLREMDHVGVSKIEEIYEENGKKILNSIKELENKCADGQIKDFLDDIKRETAESINLLTNGRLNLYTYVSIKKLKKEIEIINKYTQEGRELIEILNSMERNSKKRISLADIDREIEERLKKELKLEKECKEAVEEFKDLLARGKRDIYMKIDIDGIKNEVLAWDIDLLVLLAKRLQTISMNNPVKQIKTIFIETNKKIISEITGRRKNIYNEHRFGLYNWNVYKEKIRSNAIFKSILETDHLNYTQFINKLGILEEKEARSVEEAIDIISCAMVDDDNYVETLENSTIKKETEEERESKLAERKKEIRHILDSIEKDFCIYGSLYKTTRKIEEKKKLMLFLYGFKDHSSMVIDINEICTKRILDKNIEELVKNIRLFITISSDILFSTKINHFNNEGVAKAKMLLKKAKKSIECMDPDTITEMTKFITGFKDEDIFSLFNSGHQLDIDIDKLKHLYHAVSKSLRKSLMSKSSSKCILNSFEQEGLNDIYIILQPFCLLNKWLSYMRSYTEMWASPVFLVIKTVYSKSLKKEERAAYITYPKSFLWYEITLEKKVKLTNTTLKAFKDARTIKDIEAMCS